MKPAREVIEVNFEELEGLLERARREPLGEQDYQKLEGAIHALNYLIELIGEKDTTISCLRALLVKPSTEKTSKVLEQAGLKTSPKSSCPLPGASANQGEKPKPGHGRNGAAAYRGAERIKIPHASMKPGDRCPGCWKGKVYEQKEPALRIRVVGQAAGVGDLFMSLIHTCELNDANPFDYLTELQRHAAELPKHPVAWMPWNYRQTLQEAGTSEDSA